MNVYSDPLISKENIVNLIIHITFSELIKKEWKDKNFPDIVGQMFQLASMLEFI